MAVYLDTDWGGAFYDAFRLGLYDAADAERRRLYEEDKERRQAAFDFQRFREGKHPFYSSVLEHPKTADHVPGRLRLVKGGGLPDYVHDAGIGMLVSDKLRSLIEAIEPRGNGYSLFPVDIFQADDRRYPVQYYLWDVYRKVDAVDPDSTGVKTVGGPVDGTHLWTYAAAGTPRSREVLAVRKEMISGMVAWNDLRFGVYNIFVADALYEQMEASCLTGFSAASEWSEI